MNGSLIVSSSFDILVHTAQNIKYLDETNREVGAMRILMLGSSFTSANQMPQMLAAFIGGKVVCYVLRVMSFFMRGMAF